MSPNEFQLFCMTKMNSDLTNDEVMVSSCLGLAGEVGETVDLIKKHMYQGHTLDVTKTVKEVGDVLYYSATLLHSLGMTMEDAMTAVEAKLNKRFPTGFSVQASINRPAE